MAHTKVFCLIMGLFCFCVSQVAGQSLLSIDNCSEGYLSTIAVPIRVSVAESLTALNLRLDWDASSLSIVDVRGNPDFLHGTHGVHYRLSPGMDSQLNVVVHSPEGAVPCSSLSGVVAEVIFQRKKGVV
ncbi:hypothetical protein HQ520_02015 [bacterium]|nr:hypothetical protein [bacterium]